MQPKFLKERSNVKPVCLVMGAGAGIGGTVGRRFAREGYHACLCRRSDLDGLNSLVNAIKDDGGSASGYLLNAAEPNSIEERVAAIEADIGPIEIVVYNLGAQIGDRTLQDTSAKAFEMGWRIGTFGLYRLASAVCPPMASRGKGTILVTSSTASVRGNAGQHSHAAAMGGRRMLCQSLNAEFSSKGIHVVHIVIDGAVDAPDTLGKMLGPERFQQLRKSRGMEHDGLMLPAQIAETYVHLAQQHRSTWTHELDLRAFSDRPWWNH
jgi:NAD(P)-dependent dehydrogenase (short-subunit alcohol dehydrogenase family)